VQGFPLVFLPRYAEPETLKENAETTSRHNRLLMFRKKLQQNLITNKIAASIKCRANPWLKKYVKICLHNIYEDN
jgi:hypothetical protein